MKKMNKLLLLFILAILSGCTSIPDIYLYRATSKMSKKDIQNNYNIYVENDKDNQISNILANNGLDISQKPNAKKMLVKVFFYNIDNINIAPSYLRKTLNFKIIGIDAETKLAIFEIFTKLTTDSTYPHKYNAKTETYDGTFYRKIYHNGYIEDYNYVGYGKYEKDPFIKERTNFLIHNAIKLIGENVYIDNVSETFDIDGFLKKK